MKIGLIDVDGHNKLKKWGSAFPNLALMKISAWHKAQEFVENALTTVTEGNKVAMFLKLTFLEGKKRSKLFKNTPPNTFTYTPRGKDVAMKDTLTVPTAPLLLMRGLFGRRATKEIQ